MLSLWAAMWHLNLFGRQASERQQQINALQKLVPTARVAAEDGSLIDVSFKSTDNNQQKPMRMRVFLPPRFPMERPVLQLMQATSHPCVDRYNQVNVPYLTEWTSSHSLAELVAYVVDLLESGEEAEAPVEEPSIEPAQGEEPSQHDEEPFETMMPDIPESFPEIESMTEDQARLLLEDDAAFGDLLESMKAITSIRELRDSLRSSNEKLAKDILDEREGFETSRREALAARSHLAASLDEYQAHQRRVVDKLPADVHIAAVDHARRLADQADVKSEQLNDDFRAAKLPLQDWHKEYLAARREHHTHAALAAIYARRLDAKDS